MDNKNSSVYLKDFTDFLYTDVFFHFLRQMFVYLVGDAKAKFSHKNIDGLFPDQKERPSSKLLK